MTAERFLLVDDNTLLRASLAKLIGLWRKDAIIEEAADGHEALEKARRLRPSIILMDIRMPGCDGIEATRLIKAELPETKIIMLTVSEEEDDLFEAVSSGAHGYLLKNLRPDELFEMLEGALADEIGAAAVAAFTHTGRTVQLLSKLRPAAPIFAFCYDEAIARRLTLWRGVVPLTMRMGASTDETTQMIAAELRERRFVEMGADVVVVGASRADGDRRTNLIRLLHIRGD